MSLHTMDSDTTASPLDDVEFLARSHHRVTILAALARRPQSRADLRAMTDVSASTISRTLQEFESRDWVVRSGSHYEATQLGQFVASGVRSLLDRMEIEQTLRGVSASLPGAESGFSMEMVADATVTVAGAKNPYRPVNRFRSLLTSADRFRFAGFDVALLELCKDELCQLIVDGMEAEIINSPSVTKYIRSTCADQFTQSLQSGNLTIWLHDDLPPFGIGFVDRRVVICGYDPASGTVQVVLDTDTPAAREWAESVYDSYRRETPTFSLEQSAD